VKQLLLLLLLLLALFCVHQQQHPFPKLQVWWIAASLVISFLKQLLLLRTRVLCVHQQQHGPHQRLQAWWIAASVGVVSFLWYQQPVVVVVGVSPASSSSLLQEQIYSVVFLEEDFRDLKLLLDPAPELPMVHFLKRQRWE
jgi:fumarate reductase subunit D